MSLLRHSSRFAVLVCLISFAVWGSGCKKKTASDAGKTKTGKTASVEPAGGSKTDMNTDKTKTGDVTPMNKTRKVDTTPPPPKPKESGSGTKKRKLRKIDG